MKLDMAATRHARGRHAEGIKRLRQAFGWEHVPGKPQHGRNQRNRARGGRITGRAA